MFLSGCFWIETQHFSLLNYIKSLLGFWLISPSNEEAQGNGEIDGKREELVRVEAAREDFPPFTWSKLAQRRFRGGGV